MKPLIGITADVLPPKADWGAPISGQNTRYVNAILAAGGLPVLVPVMSDRDAQRALFDRLDGLLFSGGGDIDPALYGAESIDSQRDTHRERDEAEIRLMKLAIAHDKPVLAICRGQQVLNVALGGTLYEDLPSDMPDGLNHDISTQQKDGTYIAHRVSIDPASRLASIVGTEIDTNSHHHQAIKKAAPGLLVTGRASDGVIESVELASGRFTIGVQFHPESLAPITAQWRRLFSEFVRAARPYISGDSERNSLKTEVSEVL